MSALLQVEGVHLSFSGVKALNDVSLTVDEGQVVAVIGPNGAGKTSLFNCISGVYSPQQGRITFADTPLLGRPPYAITHLGVARMFQNLALFDQLTTLENMMLGRHRHYHSRWWHDLMFSSVTREDEIRHRTKVEDVIDFLNLERYRKSPVGTLPYGVKKRIELGRALCMEPRLLLLDEPAAGLNQEETEDLARYMLDIKEELGITQILIEHELRFVMELADSIMVLDFGNTVTEGTPEIVRNDPRVLEAYTGAAV